MKTIRTLATVMLAAFLVLGPVAALAATSTMTIGTNAASYSGMANITISGTISPAPTIASNVVITTSGSSGAVDINSVPVATGTGTFTYTLVTGGNANWVSGTYTVNGTWGAQGNTATKTTTFTYIGTSTGGPGTTVTVTSTTTAVSTVTSAVSTATVTTTVPSSDAAALQQLQVSLNGITSTLTAIQTSLTSLTSAVNTISSGVTGLTSQLTAISGNISTVNGISGQLSSLNTAVNNNQTYVLVVAALAAITLVLELAILVRKLS